MPASKSFAFQRVMRKDDRRRCSGKCALIGGKTMTAALRQQNDCALKPPTHRTLIDGVGKKRQNAPRSSLLHAATPCPSPAAAVLSRAPQPPFVFLVCICVAFCASSVKRKVALPYLAAEKALLCRLATEFQVCCLFFARHSFLNFCVEFLLLHCVKPPL